MYIVNRGLYWKQGEKDMTLTNYWWLLIWIFVGGVVMYSLDPKCREVVLGKEKVCWSKAAAIGLVIPYIIWGGFRSDIFGDTGAYRRMFQEAPSTFAEWSTYLADVTKDKGFSVITLFIKLIVGNSDQIYFLLLATIQILFVVYIYRRHSCNYWLSIFFFIASTDYMSWVHNGSRQFLAVTIVFMATELLLKKKYILYLFIVLLAATIHGSALLMIPIAYIILGDAWNKKTIFCMIAAIIALIYVDRFTNILDTLLSDTQYTNVVSDWQSWEDNGTNPIRVLVYSIPTLLSIIGLKWIKAEKDPVINLAVNASIVSTGLYLLSMGTSGIFIGRLPIYTSLYANGILLPWEIENIFTRDSARIITILAVVLYSLFFVYQMRFIWGVL